MQTNYAKIVAEALIKQGAILVGSQALIESSTADIDIACTWEQYLAVLEAEPMLNENNKYIKLHKNDYTKSTKALWNGVAFLTFIDGTELDILLYDEDILKAVSTAIKMMQSQAHIFISNKKLRVRTYEALVKTIATLQRARLRNKNKN